LCYTFVVANESRCEHITSLLVIILVTHAYPEFKAEQDPFSAKLQRSGLIC